jgi:hypothetical protein
MRGAFGHREASAQQQPGSAAAARRFRLNHEHDFGHRRSPFRADQAVRFGGAIDMPFRARATAADNVLIRLGIAAACAARFSAARKKTSQHADDFAGLTVPARGDGPFSRWTETCS